MEIGFTDNTVRLGNPNPEVPYTMVRDGQQVVVDPLRVFTLPLPVAKQMLAKAERNFSEQKMQQEEERSLFTHAEGSNDPKKQDRAKNFAKRVDGEIVTNTQPPKFPFLVNLSESKGLRIFKEGIEIAKKKGIQIPAYEEGEFLASLGTNQERSNTKEMKRPGDNWDREELRDYVKRNGGLISNADKEPQLLKKAVMLFEAVKRRYEEDGFEVVIK